MSLFYLHKTLFMFFFYFIGQNCKVQSLTDTKIVCQTPSKPDVIYSKFPGNACIEQPKVFLT